MIKEYMNVTEEIVNVLVRMLMYGTEYQIFCGCDACKNKIIAATLNVLPNYYVVNERERECAFKSLNTEESIKMINEKIINAIHTKGTYRGTPHN